VVRTFKGANFYHHPTHILGPQTLQEEKGDTNMQAQDYIFGQKVLSKFSAKVKIKLHYHEIQYV
jgi:hypothetical protein